MHTPAPEVAIREVAKMWSRLRQLADFAVLCRSYENSDVGCGVTYPADCDEDQEVIPTGFVRIYAGWGAPDGYELLVPEALYLRTLVELLREEGHLAEAARVHELLKPE
jgi:hypothetical protein